MENKEVQIEEVSVDAASNDAAPDAPVDIDPCAEYIAQIAELNDKYLRMAAELENTRRRAALDSESAARTRAMSVARNFLPVIDAVQAALKHEPENAGIIAMAGAINAAFEQIGISKIESVGQPLNPQLHNAIQVMDAPADMQPAPASNTILDEMQTGYMFGDTVLRPAMVVVSK